MHASPAESVVTGVVSGEQLESHAPALLADIANGYWLPRCLHAVAELGVADHIATAPVSAGILAQSCGANEDALYRVMRALSSHNIFEQTYDGFIHTALSRPRYLARTYSERQQNFTGQHFWARGYFVSTVGRDEAQIRDYIRNQEAEDRRLDQLEIWK